MSVSRITHLVIAVLLLGSVSLPVVASADPCLLIYPQGHAVFRFDPMHYDIINSSDPQYDPAYAVSGVMLWNNLEERVAAEVYRAPGLAGFQESSDGKSEFFAVGNTATICIDGFSEFPRQLNDIVVEFAPFPLYSAPDIYVNGERVEGLRHTIPRMVVTTPTDDGFYSDSETFDLRWVGSQFIEIIAYADKNGNHVFDGEPCVRFVMEDWTVPTESKTWGSIKSLFKAE